MKRQLLILGAALRANIQRALRGLGDEASRAWADEIAESSDLSIADSLADRRLPAIARDVAELGDTEAALQRIADGTYGACVACGYAIHPTRLARTPQAPRCRKCQQRFDRSEAGLRRARTGRASG